MEYGERESLIEQNIKMAAEIKTLKATNDETSNDNAVIRSALEVKQGEWTKVENTKSANMDKKLNDRITDYTSLHKTDSHHLILPRIKRQQLRKFR